MSASSLVRSLALVTTIAGLLLPAATQARPGREAEPVLVIPGLGQNCVTQRYDDADNPIGSGAVAAGLAWALEETKADVDPVPAADVHGWRFTACWRTLASLAKQLDRDLATLQAQSGGRPVDVVSFSFGGAIVRYCLTNPLGSTPGCRARIDDWVGIVNATNGSTKADTRACLTATLVGLGSICSSLGYQSTDVRRMNRKDPSPGAVEYSIFWTPQDEFLYPTGTSVLEGARNVVLRSKYGRVTHAGTWFGGPCTTTAQWIGLELLDVTPHQDGADRFDCNHTVGGALVEPPPPPTTPTPAPATSGQQLGPGAPSKLDAASATR